MTAAVASLDLETLSRRLAELAGQERAAQVDFLLHLAEFDARHAYLRLREGPAGRRIAAMRVLRRFPALEPGLRDGRL